MLWTIFIVVLVIWLIGVISGFLLRGFIHLLLLIAVVVLLLRIIKGRRPW